jgi:phosphate uptake regulator
MRRKLIMQGNESFTVTLPIKWIKRHDVKGEIDILEKDGTLEIKPAGAIKEKPKAKELDISALPEFLFIRLIGACYKNGYDEINLKYAAEQLKAIQTVVDKLIGYEITEKKPDFLIIKKIVTESIEQYNDSEKKCWHVLISMAEDCLEGIKKHDKKTLKAVIEADSIIDRFSDYCMYMLLKHNDIEVKNPFVSYLFLHQLEKIADLFSEIAKFNLGLEAKLKPSEEILAQHERIKKYISDFYLAYYKFDIEAVKKLVLERDSMFNSLAKTIEKAKANEKNHLIYLKEILNIFSGLITPLLIQNI